MKHQVSPASTQMKNFVQYCAVLLLLILVQQASKGQKSVVFDLTTNPQYCAQGVGSVQLQVQPFKKIAVSAGGYYNISASKLPDFDQQDNTIAATVEVLWLPFGAKLIGRKKNKRIHEICGGKYPCLIASERQQKRAFFRLLEGTYIAPGYRFERMGMELIPLPHLESPIPKFPYEIKSHAFTLSMGYQVRVYNVTLGAGYSWAFDQPTWSGPYDIFGDSLFTQTYPWKMRVQSGLRLEVGINF